MADLQKMPGGAGLLKKQAGKQKAKDRSSVSVVENVGIFSRSLNFRISLWIVSLLQHPPRSAATGGESRRNPERASRRLTRSMSGTEDPLAAEEAEVELSLEEELLEVSSVTYQQPVKVYKAFGAFVQYSAVMYIFTCDLFIGLALK